MARARAAQPRWAARAAGRAPGAASQRFRAAVVAGIETLAATLTAEVGKPIKQSRNELNGLLGRIDFFLANRARHGGRDGVRRRDGMSERIGHEPLGVVANISAWNYP